MSEGFSAPLYRYMDTIKAVFKPDGSVDLSQLEAEPGESTESLNKNSPISTLVIVQHVRVVTTGFHIPIGLTEATSNS